MAADVLKPASLRHSQADALTFRELEVLSLLVKGLSNQQIAAALFISPRTARAHVAAILAKLGVSTRAGAVSHALRHNLV
jgi:DNA-binding NarL/FixJ family response regulator